MLWVAFPSVVSEVMACFPAVLSGSPASLEQMQRIQDDTWQASTRADFVIAATGLSTAAGLADLSRAREGAATSTLSLPGLNIQWPFSQLILVGVKTVEVRTYALGHKSIAQPDVEVWLVETPASANAIVKGWALADGDSLRRSLRARPRRAQIVGAVTFSRSSQYESLAAFQADRENHRIAEGRHRYDWDGSGKRFAWHVSAFRRLTQPIPQPGQKGDTWFINPRSYTVSFVETATGLAVPLATGLQACAPEPKRLRVEPATSASSLVTYPVKLLTPRAELRCAQDVPKTCIADEDYPESSGRALDGRQPGRDIRVNPSAEDATISGDPQLAGPSTEAAPKLLHIG